MKILAFLFEGLLILAALALVIGLVRLVMRLLGMLALLAAGVSVALGGAIVAGFAAQTVIGRSGGADPDLAGTAIGVLVFAGLLVLLVPRLVRHFGEPRAAALPAAGTVPQSSAAAPTPAVPADGLAPQTSAQPQGREDDPGVHIAWEKVLTLVPAEAPRLLAARASCARLLKLAEGNISDLRLIDCGAHVRRNVPALVEHVTALWDSAGQAERAEMSSGLVEDLEKLARRSDTEFDRHRQMLRDNLQILRRHVANRADGDAAL